MSASLYDKGREAIGSAQINLSAGGDDIRVVLIDTNSYTVNLSTHDNLDDIPGGARIAVSGALQNKTITNGVFDADDIVINSVTGLVNGLVFYKHTGTESTSKLIAYEDSGITGLPATFGGGSVTLIFPSGANKIFKI